MIVDTAPELCQKVIFFMKKGIKGIFVYVLEFMLSLDKMQNISTLMCKTFEHFESYPSFSYYTHRTIYRVFWPSDWVVDCIHIDYI